MQLVDKYLKEVGKYLPEAQREDILRELSEDIRSEMEDREASFQRPLTEPEQQALLKQHGNPFILAARYRQDHRVLAVGRQLIGPVLFPFYIKVLAFNLGLTFFILGAIFLGLSVSGQHFGFHEIFSNVLLQLFIQLSVITLIFSLIERHLTKYPGHWNSREIRGVKINIENNAHHVSRFESVAVMVASLVAIGWMSAALQNQYLILGPAASFLRLAPIWYNIYLFSVLLMLAGILRALINLFRPDWLRFRTVVSIAIDAASLIILYFLIRAGSWVISSEAGSQAAASNHTIGTVNQFIYWGIWAAIVISVIQIGLNFARLIRQTRHRSPFGA